MMRLNLGSGGRIDPGWVHVDRVWPLTDGCVGHDFMTSSATFLVLDIAKDVWPWEDDSVEGIVMHHVADLLAVDELDNVLRKCHRVLEPGGVLRVSCADITRGIERAMAGDWSWCAERKFTEHGDFDREATLGHFILQGGARRQFLTRQRMHVLGRNMSIGPFQRVVDVSYRITCGEGWMYELDSRPDESWFVEVEKQK